MCSFLPVGLAERNDNGYQATFREMLDYESQRGKLSESDILISNTNQPVCSTLQESAMREGSEQHYRLLFAESLMLASEYLNIDFPFITNDRSLDEFAYRFLKENRNITRNFWSTVAA